MRLIFTLLLLAMASVSYGQENFNFELLSNVQYAEAGNDIWGYVAPDGTEYAIVGTVDNTRIYDLSDLTMPREVISIPGGNSIWRDMKSWEDYVYVTNDQTPDGLLVIDMSEVATDSIRFQYLNTDIVTSAADTIPLEQCHNIYIDENGFAYLAGCGNNDMNKAVIMDLNQDKWDPPVVGVHGDGYAHDLYVRDNIMYSSEIFNGQLVIFDVTDKANLEFLGATNTSFDFTHNTWISDDGNYAFTTDELDNAFVDSYDISDFSNIKRLDKFQPLETSGRNVVPHNTHVIGDFLVTSWYTDGVVITDASRPDNLIKVGAYDTWPDADGGTEGCWGAYPWLPSGAVLANDRRYGLFVLQPSYVKGCYLEGNVTDAMDGSVISGATVEIITDELNEGATNGSGVYKTGLANAGTYTVLFTHPFYFDTEAEAVLENGVLTLLDVQMDRPVSATVTGTVVNSETGQAIPNGLLKFTAESREFNQTGDGSGNFTIDVFQEAYTVIAGAWGFQHKVLDDFTPSGEDFIIELDPGYQDDFILDQGWVVSGDAGAGFWVRAIPEGTTFQGQTSNIGNDIDGDIGEMAYVTGNAPLDNNGAGLDDVDPMEGADSGSTILTSPDMDLSIYDEPVIEFSTYFFNAGGSGSANDTLLISITDGTTQVILDNFGRSDNTGNWTDLLRFPLTDLDLDLTYDIGLIDLSGKVIKSINQYQISNPISVSDLQPGLYLLHIMVEGRRYFEKVIIQK